MPSANLARTVKAITRVEEEEFFRKKAKLFGLVYVDLVGHPFSPKILNLVSEEVAREWRAVPYLFAKDQLRLAVDSPENLLKIKKALLALPSLRSLEVSFAVASQSSLNFALSLYAKFAAKKFQERVSRKPVLTAIKDYQELLKELPKISLTSLLDFLFQQALALDASDIHFEPQERNLRVRFRLDGALMDQVNLPPEWQVKIANRLKFLAKLKLDIKDKPQDGRFGLKI
ncbi:Flp pilus assembly complex ATPase component TadA, partial [Candidatus Berkelbacteria bacterium]|nr:Flp pilus assembly complex ATPase component TadA [Candidatus Berkelbacteria bacterium]